MHVRIRLDTLLLFVRLPVMLQLIHINSIINFVFTIVPGIGVCTRTAGGKGFKKTGLRWVKPRYFKPRQTLLLGGCVNECISKRGNAYKVSHVELGE